MASRSMTSQAKIEASLRRELPAPLQPLTAVLPSPLVTVEFPLPLVVVEFLLPLVTAESVHVGR